MNISPSIDNDLLTFLSAEHFSPLYEKQSFIDISIFSKWQVGRIVSIQGDFIQIAHMQSASHAEETLPLSSERIAYFRTHSKSGTFLSKDPHDTSFKPQLVLNNLQSVISEDFDYEGYAPHKILQFWRGKLYYQLDLVMDSVYDSKEDLGIAFMIIEAYIELLSKYFRFVNSKEIKGYVSLYEHNKLAALVSWQCALVSFYEDAIVLLKRIFISNSQEDFYAKNMTQLNKMVEQRYQSNTKLKRICKENWYNQRIKVVINDHESIPAFIFSYLSDKLNHHEGYSQLFSLITSKDAAFSFQFLLAVFSLIQYTTLGVNDDLFSSEYRCIKESIYWRINSMNDADIKENSKESVVMLIEKMTMWLKVEKETKQLLREEMVLMYYYRCFICKTLEKQVMAVNFFNEIIENIQRKPKLDKSQPQSVDTTASLPNVDNEKLVSLFKDKKVIDFILTEGIHEEILKRSNQIVMLMYRYNWGMTMTKANQHNDIVAVHSYTTYVFGLLWKYTNGSMQYSSGICRGVEQLICDMMEYATNEDKDFLYKMIEERVKGKEVIGKEDLGLLRNFTEKSLMDDGNGNCDCLYFIDDIWTYLQDEYYQSLTKPIEADKASEIIMTSVNSLITILKNPSCNIPVKAIESLISLSLENISEGKSCIQSLIFIKDLFIASQPIQKLLKALDSNPHNIIDLLLNDLHRYIKTLPIPPFNPTIILEGFFPNETNITTRLEAILLITSKDKGMPFPFNSFNTLWSICNAPPISLLFYKILQENIEKIDYILLDTFFNEILLAEASFSIETLNAYELFKATFFEVNLLNKKLLSLSHQAFRVDVSLGKDNELLGINCLWNLLLNTEPTIQEEAAQLLSEICLNTKRFDEVALPFWSSFVSRLIIEMTKAIDTDNDSAITGLLILIKKIMENIGHEGVICKTNDTSHLTKDFTVYAFKHSSIILKIPIGHDEPMHIVRFRLSNQLKLPVNRITLYQEPNTANMNQDFDCFTKLFPNANAGITVIDCSHPIVDQKHNPKTLIMNQQVLVNGLIELIYKQRDGKSYVALVWRLLKDWPRNEEISKTVSSLAVEVAVNGTEGYEKMMEMFEGRNVFLMQFVLGYIEALVRMESKEWMVMFSKGKLMGKIKGNMMEMHLKDMTSVEGYDCLRLIIGIVDIAMKYDTKDIEKEGIVIRLVEIMHEVFTESNNKEELPVKEESIFKGITFFIKHHDYYKEFIGLVTANSKVNEYLSGIITKGYLLKQNKAVKLQFFNFIMNTLSVNDTMLRREFIESILTIMLKEDNMSIVIESNYDEYFTFLSKVIEMDKKLSITQRDYESLAITMIHLIEHKTNVGGYLSVLRVILLYSETITMKILSEHNAYKILYEDCLFGKCCTSPLSKPPVKCLSEKAKSLAFDLLTILISSTPNHQIFTSLTQYHNLPQWRTSHIPNWSISLLTNIKQSYVGIKNLGCTCYMNSIFQLFFMIPSLRNTLLTFPSPALHTSLYHLQRIMASLLLYESQHCDAVAFCSSKDSCALDVREQMDIDEFFIFLIEKLEKQLKPTDHCDLIKHFFEGKTSDELIFKEETGCSHNKENDLEFYSIQLQVKNRKSVYDSLDALIDGEMMEGDNAVYCQDCDKKLPAIKRQSFKVLPRMLSFVLKRFEFDYDFMKKSKVNDYYEFPIELNMQRYMTNYLHNKPQSEVAEEKALYKLKAVVIHNGTSERGHYYIFIREDKGDDWYEFNDINIRKVTLNEVKEEAYGGEQIVFNDAENNQRVLKPANAYLLFYEKVDASSAQCETYPNVNLTTSLVLPNDISPDILTIINAEMEIYWVQKIIFEPSYHRFVLELVINALNGGFRPEEFVVFCNFLSRNVYSSQGSLASEVMMMRDDYKPISSNVGVMLNDGMLRINAKGTQTMTIEIVFEFYARFFFNVLLRAKDKVYIASAVDIMKFCMNYNVNCAIWLLEEFQCYKVICEYLIDNPQFKIKKLIVGLIYCAMLSINDKSSNDVINKSLMDLVNTYIYYILSYYDKENNLLYFVLYRFASLSARTMNYLTNQLPFIEYLLEYRQKVRSGALDLNTFGEYYIRKMKMEASKGGHAVLARNDDGYTEDQAELKKKNKVAAQFHSENYQLVLLCLLLSDKNKTVKGILEKLFNDNDFLLTLFEDAKNRQSSYAVSLFLNSLSYNNKDLSEVIQFLMLRLINSVDPLNITQVMLIFKRFLTKINDDLSSSRRKASLNKYLKIIYDHIPNLRYVSYHLSFLINLLSTEPLRIYTELFKDFIQKITNEIKDMIMMTNAGQIGEEERRLAFIREKVLDLFKATQPKRRRYDSDVDMTDFRFCIGDFVMYEGSEAMVISQLDEMVKIEMIDKVNNPNDDDKNPMTMTMTMTIKKEEKAIGGKYWVDTDYSDLVLKERYDDEI